MAKWLKGINLKDLFGCCIVFLCLLFTQLMVPVTLMGNTMYLYCVEFLIVFLFLAALIHILVKKEKIELKKYEFLTLFVFIGWFVVLTVYRYVYVGNITGGFIVLRILLFPIILVLLLRQYKLSRKSVFVGLLAFSTCINFYQIYSLIFVSESFRQIKGLKNINVYLCFALAVLPLLFYALSAYKSSCKLKKYAVNAVIIFNIFAVICFSMFSGSRLAVVVCPIVVFCSYFLTNKVTKKSVCGFIAMVAVAVVLISSVIALDVFDAKYNFYRVAGSIVKSIGLELPDTDSENSPASPNKKPNSNKTQTEAASNALDSNSMRGALWKKSIFYIQQNPVFGRHSIDIDCEVYLDGSNEPTLIIESPHNFILEMWLSLGLPGMLIYLLMLAWCALKILLSRLSVRMKLNFMLIMFVIFGFSFFQPLVTCFFAVSLILWLSMYLFMEPKNPADAWLE